MKSVERLVREPLIHFLALGALLFLLFAFVGGNEDAVGDRIEVSRAKIDQLAGTFRRTWQRPPTAGELDGLIEEYVREEVYYREALAMGLDEDDLIVRRRMRQKLEFLTDDIVGAAEPTADELQAYFNEHRQRFREPDRISFEQVFLDPDRRGDSALDDAARLLERLRASKDANPELLGDSLMLPSSFEDVSKLDVARHFGAEFAERLAGLPVVEWSGPVESGFGLHLVRLSSRLEAPQPTLGEVRDTVEEEWRRERREEAAEAFYQSLRRRYEVVVKDFGSAAQGSAAKAGDSEPRTD